MPGHSPWHWVLSNAGSSLMQAASINVVQTGLFSAVWLVSHTAYVEMKQKYIWRGLRVRCAQYNKPLTTPSIKNRFATCRDTINQTATFVLQGDNMISNKIKENMTIRINHICSGNSFQVVKHTSEITESSSTPNHILCLFQICTFRYTRF